MARREYRDATGKLKGYSQTDTERTGGKHGEKSWPTFFWPVSPWPF
jgi:hypothetical protein